MLRIDLIEPPVPEYEIAVRAGQFVTEADFDLLIGPDGQHPGPVEVYRPDGELLLKYLPEALSAEACEEAWAVMRAIGGEASNRGTAAGVKARAEVRADGSLSRTMRVPVDETSRLHGVGSAIIGAFERSSPRFPMCRLTAYNLEHPGRFARALPFIRAVDAVFREQLPDRYAAQMAEVQATHPAWTIHGTSFTTVTVNKNFRTALHTDRGDLPAGFGVMTALRAGEFRGCYTVFPEFRLAVDMRTRGVCLADVHRWHGNTVLVGKPRRYERIACVFYYRANMKKCGSPEEEVAYAAGRQPGDPIWPDRALTDEQVKGSLMEEPE